MFILHVGETIHLTTDFSPLDFVLVSVHGVILVSEEVR